jgi:hypothetical protein
MRIKLIWMALHLLAALVPFMAVGAASPAAPTQFGRWPAEFNGQPLARLELTEDEKGFVRGFPGEIARFTDGDNEIIIRWVEKETRKLHPAADCLKGSGYSVSPIPVREDAEGNFWGCVKAKKDGKSLDVCERVFDSDGHSWSDVSSWYWAAVLGRTDGPWWAMTVASESGTQGRVK